MLELISYGLCVSVLCAALFFVARLSFAFKHFAMKRLYSEPSMMKDLPSVTVCIPARNETDAMTRCLEKVIASTYPKLEIIVLDDNSGDNTSILIKSFAHAGVRFVEGAPLPDGWLGKNHALQELLDESSGTYVLFMDVDTHIEPDTIQQLVSYAQQEKVAMVSVLPRRNDSWRASSLFGTLRYFWTLAWHRVSSPAVASSAWMINRLVLKDEIGGIATYPNAIQPEAMIAAELSRQQRYRFLISSILIGVSYEKKWSSQVDTTVRLLFPLLNTSVVRAFFASIALLIINSPIVIVMTGFWTGWTLVHALAVMCVVAFVLIYGWYLTKVRSTARLFGALLWPYVSLQEALLIIVSVIQYRNHKVMWKGRPVTSSSQAVQS